MPGPEGAGRILLGRTYVETVILTFYAGVFTGQVGYDEALRVLADILYEEVRAEALRNPMVWDKFLGYLEKLFFDEFPDLVPELPDEFRRRPVAVLREILRRKANKIFNVRTMEKSTLERRIEGLLAPLIVTAAKAVFREIGSLDRRL